jgi:hypothetical protein
MYTRSVDRGHPGCIVFLLDRSGSMTDPFAASGISKATATANAVNRLLRNLILLCQRGDTIRPYFDIAIIGYGGDDVGSLFGGELAGHTLLPLDVLAAHPLRFVRETVPGRDDVGVDLPIWVEPHGSGGTPMSEALDLAGGTIVEWANKNYDSFPPIVINVTDGEATGDDPRPIAEQLRGIVTSDGPLLFFNSHLSERDDQPVQFPSAPQSLPDEFAKTLFDMSSELAPRMVAVARGLGIKMSDGARGFTFNSDAAALTEFLDVGTPTWLVADR